MDAPKNPDDFLAGGHPVVVRRDARGTFHGEVPDWPGCAAEGRTLFEMFGRLEEARRRFVEECLAAGRTPPAVRMRGTHSGRLLLRLPRSLHERLAELSELEGVSLNFYIATILAEHVGAKPPQADR